MLRSLPQELHFLHFKTQLMCVTVLRWLSCQTDAIYSKVSLVPFTDAREDWAPLCPCSVQDAPGSSRSAELALFGHGSFYSSLELWPLPMLGVSPLHLSTPHGFSPTLLGSGHHFTHHKLLPCSTTAHTLGHTHCKEVSLEKPPAALSDFPLRVQVLHGNGPSSASTTAFLSVLMSTRRNNFSNKFKGLTLLQ